MSMGLNKASDVKDDVLGNVTSFSPGTDISEEPVPSSITMRQAATKRL
jgi:hypothetical protein